MGSKGGSSGTNTVTTNSAPPPQVMQNYTNATNYAQMAASQPYTPYSGNIVAPFSDLQQSSFEGAYNPSEAYAGAAGISASEQQAAANYYGSASNPITAGANQAQGIYGGALGQYGASTTPLWANTQQYSPNAINTYMSPYTQDVVNATEQQFNNQNAIQNAGVVGNAAAQGAWGGDRSAIAQATTAGQQQAAEAPVIAGLENTGFQTAQGEFNTEQSTQLGAQEAQGWLASQAGAGEAGIASGIYGMGQGETAAELQQGAGAAGVGTNMANLGAQNANVAMSQEGLLNSLGGQQQQEAQSQLNVPYEQYAAEQAYPFQTSQFYTNATEGLGSLSGGQSSTTSPAPSELSQIAGLGIGGIGLVGATGGLGASGWLTGLLAAQGGRIDPAHGIMPHSPNVAARPMSIGIRGVPHKLKLADGGIVDWRQGEQHFDSGGSPVAGLPNDIPDLSVSVVPLSQGGGEKLGPGPPKPPTPMATPQTTAQVLGSGLSGLAGSAKNWGLNSPGGVTMTANGFPTTPTSTINAINSNAASGLYVDPASMGIIGQARGGSVPHFDAAGVVPSNDTDYKNFTPPANVPDTFTNEQGGIAGSNAPFVNLPDVSVSAPGVVVPTSASASPSDVPISDYIRQGAIARHIDPAAALHTASTEGGTGSFQLGDSGSSGGPFQLHMDDPAHPGAGNSMGDQFYRDKGLNPLDPKNERATIDYALDYAQQHGFDPNIWHGLRSKDTGTQYAQATPQGGIAPQTMSDVLPSPGITGMATPASSQKLIDSTVNGGSGLDMLRAKGVDPWLMLAIAGFGTAAGRSPQPLQNLGAGFLEATKYVQSQESPEAQLQRAQAQKAQLEVEGVRAFRADMAAGAGSTANGVNALDKTINGASKDLTAQLSPQPGAPPIPSAAAPQGAQAPPSGAAAPAAGASPTAGLPPPTPEETQMHNQVQANIAQLDAQIAMVNNNKRYASSPEQITAVQNQIAQLAIRRTELLKEDPYYTRAVAGGNALAENPALVQRAVQTKAGELPYTPFDLRPGGAHGVGTQITNYLPQRVEGYDPNTDLKNQQWDYPPGAPVPAGTDQNKIIAGPGPGRTATMTQQAEHEQAQRQTVINQANSSQQAQVTLANMARDAGKFYQGPFANEVAEARDVLRLVDPSQTVPVASYEDFIKNAGMLTRTAVKEVSSRAAVQEYNMINNTLPNPTMSPQGLRQVSNELMGLNDYHIVKAQAQQQWENAHSGSIHGFETDFQNNLTPMAFVVHRMDPATQQQIAAKLSQTDEGKAALAKLTSELQFLKTIGFSRNE
jgi:hypothetical protein